MEEINEFVKSFRFYMDENPEKVAFLNDFLIGIEGKTNAMVISMGGAGAVDSNFLELEYKKRPTIFAKDNGYVIASYSVIEDVYIDHNGELIIMVERMHGCEVIDGLSYYNSTRGKQNGNI